MLRNERLVAAALVCASLLACAPGGRGTNQNPTSCTPGSTVVCTCTDGAQGEATCNAGGSLYGVCECGVATSCDGGSEVTCGCSDGGSGVAACLADGGSGACVCGGGSNVCVPGQTAPCMCAGGASGDEICNGSGTGYGQCTCGNGCTPNAVVACTCDNGGPGTQTCNASGTTFGQCTCDAPPSCTASALTASGSVTANSSSINYSSTPVTATFQHFVGSGSPCIGTASISLALSGGSCALQLKFSEVIGSSGGLTSASLDVDSGCSSVMGVATGIYSSTAGYGLTALNVTPAIPNAVVPSICLSDATLQFGTDAITLLNGTGTVVTINLGGLTITGALYSSGSVTASCYSTSSCGTGYTESAQQWCTPAAGCGAGMHDGGNGTCVADGTCSTGYHSDGTGNCVPTGQCASGYHSDGTGNCVALGQCASGYVNGGDGTCVPAGTCSANYHNGGDGSCVPIGDCVTNDHDGGDGTCLPAGLCSTGYQITGTGTCVASSGCPSGEHDGGSGTCVATGTCSTGYELSSTGTCVATTGCATGFHNGGDGTCVANGTCSSGYQNGGDGTCVLIGSCSTGYHNGGAGVCVTTGTCSSGYTLATNGTCTASSSTCIFGSPPTANAGGSYFAAVGQTVTLDGSLSTDTTGLGGLSTYAFTFVSVPSGSNAVITAGANSAAQATFVPNVVGNYVVQLVVSDDLDGLLDCSSAPDTATVQVAQTDNKLALEIKLTWTTSQGNYGDMHLHYLAPGGTLFDDGVANGSTGDTDSDFNNTHPAWGPIGDAPWYNGDSGWGAGATTGGGIAGDTNDQPVTGLNPLITNGTYTAVAHYFCSRDDAVSPVGTADYGAATATMQVLVNGSVQYSVSQSLNQRQVWSAAKIIVSNNGSSVSFQPGTGVSTITSTTQYVDPSTSDDLGGCTAATN